MLSSAVLAKVFLFSVYRIFTSKKQAHEIVSLMLTYVTDWQLYILKFDWCITFFKMLLL